MSLLQKTAQRLGSSLRQKIATNVQQARKNATSTLNKDDYMQNVKWPGLWIFGAIYGFLMFGCIRHAAKMDKVYEELQINRMPLKDRPRPPDHELLSAYTTMRLP